MSDTSFHKNKSRKKVVATTMIGGLLSLTLVGGTYAGLAASIATEEGTDSVSNTLAYFYAWMASSDPINADVTPVTSPTEQVFTKPVENNSSVASHFALWASGVDVASIPASLLDETSVRVSVSDGTTSKEITTNLRSFLTSAWIFTENDEAIILPAHSDLTLTVGITAPDNTGSVDFSDVLEFTSESFITNMSFNQVIGGTSDLWNYMESNSTFGDENFTAAPVVGGALTY